MPPRPYILAEANHRQLAHSPPQVAILPWGATESHNWHLPYGTDVFEGTGLAQEAARRAWERGARVIVLPTIPYGNDEQQLDQECTISITTLTARAILGDVARSLVAQGIDRLVVVNAHGGNQFQGLVRDLQSEFGLLIVVANFYQMAPESCAEIFEEPGDHAGELETSLMLHLHPELVELAQAGEGQRVPFAIEGLKQPGVWTPRPWSRCQPDTGCGNPSAATQEKGRKYFEAVTSAMADLFVDLARAEKGDLPYV
jgi:creatinine amidohydrolase